MRSKKLAVDLSNLGNSTVLDYKKKKGFNASESFDEYRDKYYKQVEDLSAFLHESAHYYLEVYKDIYESGIGNEEIRSDMETAIKYLGMNSFEKLSTENHEKFAKAFETYLKEEGKAPSLELRDVFSRIKLWLFDIYKSVRGLNVKLSDEIRGVFDRMLATKEEISRVKQENDLVELFTTDEDAGMTEDKFKNYKKELKQAHLKAKEDLEQKYFSQFKREKEKWGTTKKKEVRERVVKKFGDCSIETDTK